MTALLTRPRETTQKLTPTRLNNGDRLSMAEFKRLYEASPHIRRAELIEGVVYVASPVFLPHARAQANAITWLGNYQVKTPHTIVTGEQSVELDIDNGVQPDALLWIEGDIDEEGGLVVGSPTLVVEVAASTRSYDLGIKKRVYRRNKVKEYLVFAALEEEIHWFYWDDGIYKEIEPDEKGIYQSRVFGGLWLEGEAFWKRDMAQVLKVLGEGMESAEHAQFIKTLTNRV